jgi:hypothetical protein
MLRFELDVSAADVAERTIVGVLMPYGETGEIEGVRYRFHEGSIKPGRARTPLLVDHDRGNPIGVLSAIADVEGAGAVGEFKVDATPAGDTALVQAASGSRGGLSVGAELDKYAPGRDGVVDVYAARVLETSLVALGAFDGAAVTRVAAEADPEPEPEPEPEEPEPPAPNPDQLEIPAPPSEAPEPEEAPMQEATAEAAAPVIRATADRPARELQAGELVQLIVRAQHGEPEARRYLEAALTETAAADVSGLLPPTYERTVIGATEVSRPLYNAFRGRPLPGVGLLVSKPKWTTKPNGAWATAIDADATTSGVVIGSQTADVIRWDWAGAIPWVVVQRSDPSIVDEIYGEAVQSFYLDVESKIYAELSAANPGLSTTMGAALAEFYTATGNQRGAEIIVMAPDVWGDFADVGQLSVPLAQGAVSSDLSTSFAGIRAVSSGTLAAGEVILATRRAVDARITDPVRLTANAIGALNVELAVVGEGLFDTDYPGELLKFAAIVPAAAAAARASSRSSK